MTDYIENTEAGTYRITRDGKIFIKPTLRIPIVGKGMEFSGEFKYIFKPERELKYIINNRGYMSIMTRGKTSMVHRLVAFAFILNPENKPFINHKDGNKLNNHVDNLEWCTTAENNKHARETGLHIQLSGHKLNYKSSTSKKTALANLKDKSKLTPDEVRYVRNVHVPRSKEFSATALAMQFGTSVAAMCKIVSGVSYSHIV